MINIPLVTIMILILESINLIGKLSMNFSDIIIKDVSTYDRRRITEFAGFFVSKLT